MRAFMPAGGNTRRYQLLQALGKGRFDGIVYKTQVRGELRTIII
jgi:hypothetical protein